LAVALHKAVVHFSKLIPVGVFLREMLVRALRDRYFIFYKVAEALEVDIDDEVKADEEHTHNYDGDLPEVLLFNWVLEVLPQDLLRIHDRKDVQTVAAEGPCVRQALLRGHELVFQPILERSSSVHILQNQL